VRRLANLWVQNCIERKQAWVHKTSSTPSRADCLLFREALLRDLHALEQMLKSALETDVVRVGIEQEMFLVDSSYRPAPVASQVLAGLSDAAFTNEIGKFNLEANMQRRVLEGSCLRSIESELIDMFSVRRRPPGSMAPMYC
jgi:hypothetical protein